MSWIDVSVGSPGTIGPTQPANTFLGNTYQLVNGDILIVDQNMNLIYRSTDNGITWDAGMTLPGQAIVFLLQLANGNLLAFDISTNTVYKSLDNGITWDSGTIITSKNGVSINDVYQLVNGDILVVDGNLNTIYKSTDNGTTWDNGILIDNGATLWGILQLTNGNIIISGYSNGKIYKSTDNGITWDNGTLIAVGVYIVDMIQITNGDILVIDYNSGNVYKSTDNCITWDSGTLVTTHGENPSQFRGQLWNILQLTNGDILATCDNNYGYVYKSSNNGVTWSETQISQIISGVGVGIYDLIQITNDSIIATDCSNSVVWIDNIGDNPMTSSRTKILSSQIALTEDQNFVTAAELSVIENTSGTNTGDQDLSSYLTKTGNGSSLTGITASQVGLGSVTDDAQLKASNLTTDGTLASDSDTLIPSEKAVKTYIDNAIGNLPQPMQFKGVIDCSANPNYPAATAGYVYTISVAGKIGGASGVQVEAGDQVLCITTNIGGTQASVGADFDIVQFNLVNAVTSASTVSTVGNIVVMDSTNGQIVEDSGIALSSLASATTLNRESFTATALQTLFTLAHTPVSLSESVYENGMYQTVGVGDDYTISGAAITFTSAMVGGERVTVTYQY